MRMNIIVVWGSLLYAVTIAADSNTVPNTKTIVLAPKAILTITSRTDGSTLILTNIATLKVRVSKEPEMTSLRGDTRRSNRQGETCTVSRSSTTVRSVNVSTHIETHVPQVTKSTEKPSSPVSLSSSDIHSWNNAGINNKAHDQYGTRSGEGISGLTTSTVVVVKRTQDNLPVNTIGKSIAIGREESVDNINSPASLIERGHEEELRIANSGGTRVVRSESDVSVVVRPSSVVKHREQSQGVISTVQPSVIESKRAVFSQRYIGGTSRIVCNSSESDNVVATKTGICTTDSNISVTWNIRLVNNGNQTILIEGFQDVLPVHWEVVRVSQPSVRLSVINGQTVVSLNCTDTVAPHSEWTVKIECRIKDY